MTNIQTLNEISRDYFNDHFMDLSIKAQTVIIEIQRNQILQAQLELEKSRIRDTTYIDD